MNNNQFKQLRKATGLHPTAIAKDMGVTRNMVYMWESGERVISALRAEQILNIARRRYYLLGLILKGLK